MSTQTTRRGGGDPGQGEEEEPSVFARLPEILARAAWEHRWRLAPFYLGACTATGVGMGHGLAMASGLGAAAVAAEASTRLDTDTQRVGLSGRERRLAAIALAGTGVWAGLVSTVGSLPLLGEVGLLAGVLVWPAQQWWASRAPLEPQPEVSPYSPLATNVLNGWVNEITVGQGPRMMRGSVPLVDTLTEPTEGAMAIEVQLAKGVAAKKVIGEANRQEVEALFTLPEDTLRLETVRNDSTRLRVVITASRHLEIDGGLDWPGPVLEDNGDIPLAVTGDGSVICIPLFAKDGVRHGMITGTTGVGKSVTSVSFLTPGVKAGLVVILYLDGKRGTSAPYLRPIITRYARMDQQWPVLIEIAFKIMKERENRRGAMGKDQFRAWEEDDPIIVVFIDEPNSINNSTFWKAKHVRMVLEILEHGRALGVVLVQCGQSPAGEDLIGGVQARGLMSGGWSVNHRAGGKGASRLTLDSTNAAVSLLELPVGGAAITVGGKLVGFPAQIRNATRERVEEEMDGVHARDLAGHDLQAAGPEWNAAHWEDCFTPGYTFDATTPATPAARSPRPPAQGEYIPSLGATWVVSLLQERGPMSAEQLLEALPGLSASVMPHVLQELIGHELVIHAGDQYALTPLVTFSQEPAAPHEQQEEPAEDLPASRMWVLDQLTDHPEGLSLGQLADLPGHPSRRTITNSLADLMARREVAKTGAIWTRLQAPEAVDHPLE